MSVVLIIVVVILLVIGIGALFGAPWVPTRRAWIRDALKLAEVGARDVVVDLGSGDGAVVRESLEFGAKRAIGYEINPLLVAWSRLKLRKFNRRDSRAEIIAGDFFVHDLPRNTTVIYLFGVGKIMPRVTKYLKQQRPKLRTKTLKIISFGFTIPDFTEKKSRGGMHLYEI